MHRIVRRCIGWGLFCGAVCSCFAAPEPPDAALASPQLLASDATGKAANLTRLPRRPLLVLESSSLAPDATAWLFGGTLDAALAKDLERLPLTAASMQRLVRVRATRRANGLEVEPLTTLRRGARYTFALPHAALGMSSDAWTAELQIDADASAGALVRGTFPAPDASAVPCGMSAAWLSLDGPVTGYEDGIWLQDQAGQALDASLAEVPCDDVDTAAVSCIRLVPEAALAPDQHHALMSGRALRDAHGAEVEPIASGFTTALTAGPSPAVVAPDCALDELAIPGGCALLFDDAVELRLAADGGTRLLAVLDERSFARLPMRVAEPLRWDGLQPDHDYGLRLERIDAIGGSDAHTLTLRTLPALATLSISEVRADPEGREPDQEYVELLNYGSGSVSLRGIALADAPDDAGMTLTQDVQLAPGARALLVADTFSTDSALDVAPAIGTQLLRLGKTLTRGGLSNTGEALYLRDAGGHRLSAAPASPPPRPGLCVVRASDDPRTGVEGSFGYDPNGSCTPGT